MDFKKLAQENKQEAIELLTKLVKIDSVLDPSTATPSMPFGKGINEALETFLEIAKNDGFDVENVDGYAGRIIYKGATDERIAILGHLDVVPTGEGWTNPPFSATILNNKMYGRGTTDDKGPTVAAYMGLKVLKNLGIKLNKTIEIILGTDEETGWRGLAHYEEKYNLPDVGFSPDAEFPLINGEKGILRMILKGKGCSDFTLAGGNIFNAVIGKAQATTKINLVDEFSDYLEEHNLQGDCEFDGTNYIYTLIGVTAHAMQPQEGINAGTHLANFLSKYINHPTLKLISSNIHEDYNLCKLGLKTTHPVMGIITNNIGIMDFNEECSKFTFDIRYPIGFEFKNFETALRNILSIYDVTFEVVEDKEPHYVSEDDDLVKTLYGIYVKHTGDTVHKPRSIGGGTYARALKHGVAFGMEEVDKPSVCHMTDEYVDLDKFEEALGIYMEAIYELGK